MILWGKIKEEGLRGTDVGFPSVCCEYVLLSLVNKEAAFDQWLNRIKPGGKCEQRCRETVLRVEETLCSCQSTNMLALESNNLVVIHSLIEMG